MKILQRKDLIVKFFFLFVALVYFHNLTRDIYSGDIGDLVTASYVFGVAHPPGYPLFTFLGFIFSHLPLPLAPVTKVAAISAITSFIGLILFYKICLRFTKSVFLSLLSVATLAFSYLFWLHAEIPEVFGLNDFFTIVILYFTINFYYEKKMRYLYATFLFCALGLTHHQTIIFVFPAVLILASKHYGLIFKSKSHIVLLIIFGLVGFLPYLYVPIAASTHPVVNWDNAQTLTNFMHLITRKDYAPKTGFAYAPGAGLTVKTTAISFHNYIQSIITTFSYQIMFVALFGAIYLFMYKKRLFLALLLSFLLSGPVLAIYLSALETSSASWGVIERFYAMSSVIFMFFVPFGFLYIKMLLEKMIKNPLYTSILLGYFLIIPLLSFFYTFPKTDLSSTQIGNTLASDIVDYLPKNSVLHIYADTITFNVWYYKYVLNKRPDVDLIHPSGPNGNNFFDDEINKYNQTHHVSNIALLPSLTLEEIRKTRPVYSTYLIPYPTDTSILIPEGLVYKLIYKKDLPTRDEYLKNLQTIWHAYHPAIFDNLKPNEQNLVTEEIPLYYSNGLLNSANFLITQYSDIHDALVYYQKAIDIDPNNSGAWVSLGIGQIQADKNCRAGIPNILKGIDVYPLLRKYYLQLYAGYIWCGKKQEASKLVIYYNHFFKRNLAEDIKKLNIPL